MPELSNAQSFRIPNLPAAQIWFLFGIFVLIIGGLNWGVVAIRQTIKNDNNEIPDALTWLTYWGGLRL